MKNQKIALLLVIITAITTALFLPGLACAEEIIVDNWNATVDLDVNWSTYSGSAPTYGYDCRYITEGSGGDTVTWAPDVSEAGTYEVYAWWIYGSKRATNVPYTIHYDGGSETVRVNQKASGTGGQWNLLGTYDFASGTSGYVVLSDGPAAGGVVVADAVRFRFLDSDVLIVDNPDATVFTEGYWHRLSGCPDGYETDLRYKAEGDGTYYVTYRPDLPVDGDYNVYAWWIHGSKRATNAPYTITYNGGSETVRVNQKATSGQWNLLGTYPFVAGTSGYAELRDGPGAAGVVIADAVKWELQPLPTYAPVAKTGQTTSYAPGDDGDLEQGVTWPHPRFTNNGDGTVTDNLTGLIWLKNADCDGTKIWADALTFCNGLAEGTCGLSDGSVPGEWRLPNLRELQSLIDYGNWDPALPNIHPFDNVQPDFYWSSTTVMSTSDYAWLVCIDTGRLFLNQEKSYAIYVWPVRGGN